MRFLTLLLLIFLLLSCTERKPDNPFDPQVDISSWTPTNLQIATLNQNTIKLTWTDNSDHLPAGSTVTFNIEKKTGNGDFTLAGTTHINEFTETELLPNTAYIWRVTASADENASDYAQSNTWQLSPENWAPTNLVVETLAITSIRLSWQDNSFVETGFQIERKTGSFEFAVIDTVASNVNQYTDIDLSQNTLYSYRIRAMQNTIYSGYTSVVPWQMTPDSWAPSILTIATISQTSIRLNWQDNCTGEQGFKIERKIGNGSYNTIATLNADSIQYTDDNLTHNTLYTYRVRAYAGENYSNYSSEATLPLPPSVWAPTDLTVTTISPTSVRLHWQDNCNWEEGFQIKRKTGTGSFNIIETVSENTIQYSDTNLSIGTQYSYLVRAFVGDNYSSYTSVVTWSYTSIMPVNFVLVAGSMFNNGISDVTLSSFYIDKYELTQADYQAVMGSNPSYGYGVGEHYPVYNVSWFNAIEYCNRRSINEGLTPCYTYSTYGTNPTTWPANWNYDSNNHTNVACSWTANGYRLPTEAEWQFAALGGNQTHNYTYSGSDDINVVAWYTSNSGGIAHTAGTKTANELGLFDMSGNIWEWVWDIYGNYPAGTQNNPHGNVSGSYRVRRGGSWYDNANDCTVSLRNCGDTTYTNFGIGFRCVRVSP